MRVAIRTDASFSIGTGHVMRCLALAKRLQRRGATIFFICRNLEEHLGALLEEQGFAVMRLPATGQDAADAAGSWLMDAADSQDAIGALGGTLDLLVVDHYGLDARWEKALRPLAARVFVIDDLADRSHDCDVLLDQNLHDMPESRYARLVPDSARVFVGPRYALLRAEFDSAAVRLRDQGLRRLLIFMGGTDPSNEALKLVLALRSMGSRAPLATCVLGPANPHATVVRQAAQGMENIVIVPATGEMAKLMEEADLAVGTCGGAAWERCMLGLPALVVVNAENQRDDARILDAMGAVRNLGDAVSISMQRWAAEIAALQKDPAALQRMSQASASVMRDRAQALQELEAALVG